MTQSIIPLGSTCTDFQGGIATAALSVVILANNEEKFIERCIRSVISWADEVVLLDSGSVDRTKEIAASLGAKVYEQKWLGLMAKQKNRGISLAKNDWIFYLEADEIVTPELSRSILQVMSGSPDPQHAYSVDRRGDFLGILLPNLSRPKNQRRDFRLFNRKYNSEFDTTTKVHESLLFTGKGIPLRGILLHWRAYKMDEYITAFNRYATVEAEVLDEKGCRANTFTIVFRPFLRFLWCYVGTGSFRLGMRGLIHAILKAMSEYICYAKLWEMQNPTLTIHPPADVYQDTCSSTSTTARQFTSLQQHTEVSS